MVVKIEKKTMNGTVESLILASLFSPHDDDDEYRLLNHNSIELNCFSLVNRKTLVNKHLLP